MSNTPRARQFTVDMSVANMLPFAALVLQHARALRSLRAVYNSRTAWIGAAELAARHARDAHSERDQYAETARQAINSAVDSAARVTALQAAVDSKADWRPPARVVDDPAALEALPVGSIVVDFYEAGCTRISPDPVFGWVRAGSALASGRHYSAPHLPVTVLYVPTEETGRV